MSLNRTEEQPNPSWLDRNLPVAITHINVEKALYMLLLILAIVSRFTILGARVMSHDEVNHVRPSWELYTGQGYRHDPITHGPLQFHLVALSYTLFGDTDFTSRLPAALFSIATVMLAWKFRRYLGRLGALLAGIFMLISPYMLFYGRYTRNESYVALWGVMTLYGLLRYLEEGQEKHLLLLAAVTALQFVTKETSFIYSAQLLLFLLVIFAARLFKRNWQRVPITAVPALLAGLLMGVAAGGLMLAGKAQVTPPDPALAAQVAVPFMYSKLPLILLGGGVLLLGFGIYQVARGVGMDTIRQERTFDLLMLVGTFVLPQLSALPIKLLGFDPLDYSTEGMTRTGIVLGITIGISVVLGIWWRRPTWWKAAVIFYAIYIVFYTTIFTNGQGFFTGIIGSLGYWLAQQSVQRGSQPLYYYALVQIPMYEYLPAIGSILGVTQLIKLLRTGKHDAEGDGPGSVKQPEHGSARSIAAELPDETKRVIQSARQRVTEPADIKMTVSETEGPADATQKDGSISAVFLYGLLIYWALTSLAAYTYAGERMPWLTVHIAWPMILLAGLAFGRALEGTDWKKLWSKPGALAIVAITLLAISGTRLVNALLQPIAPFAGKELDQLSATTAFIFAVVFLVGALACLVYVARRWPEYPYRKLGLAALLVLLVGLTARSSYLANYINYDTAKEYLVYAHAARGPKDVLKQVEEISQRIAGGKNLQVAYDNSSLYPYWWYLRDYANLDYFGDKPSKTLRDVPVVIVGSPNYGKVDPILEKDYYSFEYMRLWWPNQDYYNLTWERVKNAIMDPAIRAGIFDIWLNHDYTQYAAATGSTALTLESWEPAERMKLFIRKDIAAQIWDLGLAPQPIVEQPDPYAAVTIPLQADIVIGGTGTEAGLFDAPRALAVAKDGSLYVADSRNHRIQHLGVDGSVYGSWGSFADVSQGSAPGGTFNEPWGVAVGPDGSVYVADTWNHRVQKFDANGKFITMWGYFGQAEKPEAFWGPRGIYVDASGKVFVADTGNKRIVVFNSNGGYITQFGSYGMEPGQFDEPVGVWGDAAGKIYVTDTWNLRIQVFAPDESSTLYGVINSWDVTAWDGQSLDNKPFLSIGTDGQIFVVDPEGYRVLEFNADGSIARVWGEYSPDADGFGLASGVAVDRNGGVWVSDGANNRLLHFTLP
jgi:predicted membrane-bound mannosyltransferase/DNA-binding beta-propeller fold protein YncE